MQNEKLFIFLEGNDDERFFNIILRPILTEKFDSIEIIKYSQLRKKFIKKFLKSIDELSSHYIFLSDIDVNPCFPKKKEALKKIYECIVEDRISVVIMEIESWYLAGLDPQSSKDLDIPNYGETNSLCKEHFNEIIPSKFDSRIDFMVEILKRYAIEIAKRKNSSFRYFMNKYI
ncbi:hypothetical protein CEE45_01515 [Candidatus Heimdallarchaeota archaeon B3_Heim]|nr:MAG: hypothetical protein CEE45_01515 [Candidatus Heimdallarchaeota archaeon B3_Heim]